MSDSDFRTEFDLIQEEQEALNARRAQARRDGIKYVQGVIDQLGIKQNELKFSETGVCGMGKECKAVRAPAKPKYMLPNGVTWSGKGIMKTEFKKYLETNGLTKADLEQFLIKD